MGVKMTDNNTSYPTINSMQKEYAEQLRAVHELIEEYRTSNDYTMARAHITLFKIDEIITGFDSSPTTITKEES